LKSGKGTKNRAHGIVQSDIFGTFITELRTGLKRFVAHIVLLAFIFNICGYYLTYEVTRYLARQEMKTFLAKTPRKLTTFDLPASGHIPGLVWIHEKEFRYKGEMYDVVTKVASGTCIRLYCFRDMKEEILIAAFEKISKGKLATSLSMHIIKIALPLYAARYTPVESWSFLFPETLQDLSFMPHSPFLPPPKRS
jgi:hypothetical protein